ncbi:MULTISPECIES: trypsin-like peptidase domain-containing protein [Pseudomonas]|uniref:trypsin-like peptidase domain-containing protein n=1 Tax=Pseudomonas TaxID=286 RepID=UPI00048863F3|nr:MULTISPECIES: trypsin-like peptidase domain-containing protein [Pseudomonas]MBC3484063.1 trypsin-like peptidase domain-containing protein [Pseudomonas sp. SWRI50]USS57860.1 trypsin-like peptidase domain-containing protein [Pseudomonas kermanshahensis]UVL69424.1 trypsin-like peptidase domain-containing protein [Pseudomonas sp. B21-031]
MLLSGCNGVPTSYVSDPVYSQAFVVTSGAPLPLLLMASAIQWNEDYAVTAKHTPFLRNVVHEGLGDVVFFKHKASEVPHWRQYVPGESVTAVGFNSLMIPVQGKGHALPSLVRLEGTPGSVFYSLHDGPMVKGMSGGPVFADDGQVVGINIAFIPKNEIDARTRPDLADKERVSVFMSYSEIDKEWRRFQYLLARKAKPHAPAAIKGIVAVAAKP